MYQAWIRKSVADHTWALELPEVVYLNTDLVSLSPHFKTIQVLYGRTDAVYRPVAVSTLGELADDYARMQYWRTLTEHVCLHKCVRCGFLFNCEKGEIVHHNDASTAYCEACLNIAYDKLADHILGLLGLVVSNVRHMVELAEDEGGVLTALQYLQSVTVPAEQLAIDSAVEED